MLALLHDDGDVFVLFFRRDLNPPVNGRKEEAQNRYYSSYQQALRDARQKECEGYDVYIKHATLAHTPSRGERLDCHASNIRASRSFLVDLDCGPGKPYAAVNDALRATLQLLKQRALPLPTLLLATGHGLHVVWSLSELVDKAEWTVLRHLLYLKVRTLGLKPDPGAEPIDRAVRLCGPDFTNKKGGGSTPTRVLLTNPRIPVDTFRLEINPSGIPAIPNSMENKFHEPKKHDPWDIPMDDVHWNPQDSLDHCMVMRSAYETGGALHSYPLFADLIALCSKASDEDQGRALAHELSYAHDGYSPEYVDDKFNTFLPNRKHILCATLARHDGGMLCKTCVFKDVVKSPAGIPNKLAQASFVQTDPFADTGYYNGVNGLMRRARETEDYDPLIWPGYAVSDITLSEAQDPPTYVLSFTANTVGSARTHSIRLDMAHIAEPRAYGTAMAHQGMSLTPYACKELYSAMVAWMTSIRKRGASLRAYERLGWTKDDDGFVLGDRHYLPGVQPVEFHADRTMQQFRPAGKQYDYDAALRDIMNNELRPEVHAHLACSLAAPLISLTAASGGGVINFYSPKSGRGKSTITKVAGSFWGAPSASLGGVDDTPNATIARLGTLNNLPSFLDEARPINPQEFAKNMLFRTQHGHEKRRLTAAAQQQAIASWSTLQIITSNSSLGTALYNMRHQGDAPAARYLEMPYYPLSQGNADNIDLVSTATRMLDNTHGHVGPPYVQYLVNNRATVMKVLDARFVQLMGLTKLTPDDTAGRLHAHIGSCIITAAFIAARDLGLPIDPQLVVKAVAAAVKRATQVRSESQTALDPDVILDHYLRAAEANRIRTVGNDPTVINSGRRLAPEHPHVHTPVAYEINETAREIIVDIKRFGEAIAEEGHHADQVLRVLQKKYGVIQRIIGYGTPYASGDRAVLTLPDATPWSGYFI